MRRPVLALVALLLATTGGLVVAPVAQSATAAPDRWRPRPAQFPAVHVTEDVPVQMSDGVVLSVNVYRPARADGTPVRRRFPVVLTQTPYNKSTGAFRNDYLVQRGYVQVEADVRGTGSSGGTWASFDGREQQDSYELVRWAHSSRRPVEQRRRRPLGHLLRRDQPVLHRGTPASGAPGDVPHRPRR